MTLFLLKVLSNAALALASMLAGSLLTIAVIKLRQRGTAPRGSDQAETENAERTNRAIEQIRQLAEDVASDVGDHNSALKGWSEQLDATQQNGGDQSAEIHLLVTDMLAANRQLSARLDDAERKIACQADEIRTQQADARTDALTSLPNRRAFDANLAEALSQSAKTNAHCSLIIFDIDHFKKFNDAHGHLAGDEVLRSVARTLASQIRSPHSAARYGGEEFAVILPATIAPQAQTVSERVRLAIENTAVMHDGKMLSVTASLGIATATVGDRQRDLIRRADEAVYAAKAAGRNRSYRHNGRETLPVATTPHASTVGSAAKLGKLPSILGDIFVQAAGLPNRDQFIESLSARRLNSPGGVSSLLILRLEEFPHLSDHDEVTSAKLLCDYVATAISSNFRDADAIGSVGQGEFIVVLPDSSQSAARIVGERIRTAIESRSIPTYGGTSHLEISVGVAVLDADVSIDEAISSAQNNALSALAHITD